MKKFRFRLERVLQYRQVVREEKRRVLALANAKRSEAQMVLEDLEARDLASLLPESGIAEVGLFLMAGMYKARLKEEIVHQRLAIIEIEKEIEIALADYIEAGKAARSLELLKEKKQREYAEYVEKEEGKALDELVTQRTRLSQ